jgi:DNA-directed RNA polymerase alpha subunit
MHAARDRDADRRTSAARGIPVLALMREQPVPPLCPPSGATVSISAETYALLLSLADQAPLDCLPLSARTLECAKTLGYNQIGQIRNTPRSRLLADLGEERAEELSLALHDFGMRQPGAADAAG